MADSFHEPPVERPFGREKQKESPTGPKSPFRISRPQQSQEPRLQRNVEHEPPAPDDDSADDAPQDEWNPFWGPRPSEGGQEADKEDPVKEEELEKERNESLVRSLKGGVASIGASSDVFIPFPSQNDILEQVHKMLKKLVSYRENWTRGIAVSQERSILHKEVMILIVSIDHYKKCHKTYFASLDIIMELLANTERVLSPAGTGVILPGTIDVYNQEIKSLFSISESEKKVAAISRLLGFAGFAMIIAGIVKPELSRFCPVLIGGLLLLSSIIYQKLYFWKHYASRP